MSKYLNGLHKGEEIMIECDKGRRWTDHGNNVFLDLEFDEDHNSLDTFRVAERLRGNTHTVWMTGATFEAALNLAERLVIGKDYLPPRHPSSPKFDIGDTLPGDFHCHMIGDRELADVYDRDVVNLFEIPRANFIAFLPNGVRTTNKVATVVSVDENENMMITYEYDHRFYTGVLKRKK